MAIVPQKQLFGWNEISELGDLQRLKLVFDYMPDEEFMTELEKERAHGRDDYPIRAVWNSILAGIVFQHSSIESLRRELMRNGQLREICGFDVLLGADAVPSPWAYTRFLRKLIDWIEWIEAMFDRLVEELCEEIPDFGRVLAQDGKIIESHARGKKKEQQKADGRRDTDADFTMKTYRGQRQDGSLWENLTRYFGYRLHLLVDATYELPVGYEVTKASTSEVKVAHKLLSKVENRTPKVIERAEYFLGDRGYDDGKLIVKLWDEYRIKPVIDIRNVWRDGEETKVLSQGKWDNIVYDYRGQVYCYCPQTLKKREMAYGGFEKGRQTLKYRCPAKHYGIECRGRDQCPVGSAVRIPLEEDRRVFTPLARSSYRWKNQYKKRTAVERVNSRLDVSFGFENHFIRGLKKMKLRCSLALVVMLVMALGRIKEKKHGDIRSLVKAA